MSHIMPEHAVAALLIPILGDISGTFERKNVLNQYLYFSIFLGCVTGGVVTFLGGARNPLAVGILNEMTGKNISFIKWWAGASAPIYVLMAMILLYLKKRSVRRSVLERLRISLKSQVIIG